MTTQYSFQVKLSNSTLIKIGICQMRCCEPFHPQSNGQAEPFGQTEDELQDKMECLVTQPTKLHDSTT